MRSQTSPKAAGARAASATRESGDQTPVARAERVWGVRSAA